MRENKKLEFESFYIQYRENIFKVCALMLKDYQHAEDAMQETFYKALCRFDRFKRESSALTWLTRIAINVCKDKLKKKSSLETPGEDVDILIYEEEIDSKLSVTDAVRALPLELREVVILYYYQEFTHKEIADIVGISVPNVAYRLRTAKSKLKTYLAEDNDE